MARSARQADVLDDNDAGGLLRQAAGVVTRNPAVAGGSTAFLVALCYVSANALWYQPHAHSSAFFSTRGLESYAGAKLQTTIRIERQPARVAQGDPVTRKVQTVLRDLNFYAGAVDGIPGPNTRKAVETYQRTVGLAVTGIINQTLLDQIEGSPSTAAIAKVPAEKPVVEEPIPARFDGGAASDLKARISKIQAGLRAFGNDDIEVDGLLGARTKAAIREFQSLFGLPETGEPDQAVAAKMAEIGLTD